jgi:hypothetical protein
MTKDEKGYRVEYVPLSELERWPRNPKKHDEPGIDASLERFGFTNPLMMDERTKRLVAGHGRLEALQRRQAAGKEPPKNIAKKGKDWMVPVVRGVSFASEAEAEAYLLADNRLTEIGGWDDKMMNDVLASLGSVDGGLVGTGFSAEDVASMLRQASVDEKPPVGNTPQELTEKFEAAEIKQVVLYFEGPQYDAVVTRLASAQAKLGVSTNTEAFLKLLDHWEGSQNTNAAPAPAAPEA